MPWKLLVSTCSFLPIFSRALETSSDNLSNLFLTSGRLSFTDPWYFLVWSMWALHSLPSFPALFILSLWATLSTSSIHSSLPIEDCRICCCNNSCSSVFCFAPGLPKSRSSSMSPPSLAYSLTCISATSALPSNSLSMSSPSSSPKPPPSSRIYGFLNLNLFYKLIWHNLVSTMQTPSPKPCLSLFGGISSSIPSFFISNTTFWDAVTGSSYLLQPVTWWLFIESNHETKETKLMNYSLELVCCEAK